MRLLLLTTGCFEKLVGMRMIPVLEDPEPVGRSEDEAVSMHVNTSDRASVMRLEAQLERLASTVKMLVFVVCIFVVVGIIYILKQ